MSSNNSSRKVVTVDEQAFERTEDAGVDEDGFEVVDDKPEFRATVQQETQAKVDSNHPDGIVQDFSHLPLAQEEKIRAREAELEHISAQAELGTQDGRAKRTREVVTERRQRKRAERTPERTDPRERLSRMELAKVNQEADRIAQRLRTDHSRAAVSRVLARRVARGQDITEAVFATMDELKAAPGAICPIEDVPDVPTDEVSIEGEIVKLWPPSDSAIAQVGLIADDTAATKFTVWRKSDCTAVAEGERVRLREAKVNWHQGRWSLALTYNSMIVFPDRDDRWWEE
ncbi:DNA-binding protein [Halorubrum sp. CBA1229]|uniref:DNA-binding protein n=1 Tax=Halorubrum sp. CBA1229 TaxID=1853699 RepID=UPI000F3F9CF6|nr:DNA-binding protein [Halorubrum sp. CBA1229]QKY18631.1 DNA-binding protein [Halorubrum sp. CBA1229]